MKKISQIIITILSIVFFIMAMYITVFGAIARKNNSLLNFFGYSYAYVPTPSMSGSNDDSFGENSIIVTKKSAYENIEIGDIVVYFNGDKLIVHRIIREEIDGFVAKGDANSGEDSVRVTKDNYRGIVSSSYPFFGFGETIAKNQAKILLVMIIGLFIYLFFQLIGIIKMIHKNKLELAYDEKYQMMKKEILKEIEESNYEK